MRMFEIMELALAAAVAIYTFFRVRRLFCFYGADRKRLWVLAVSLLIAISVGATCRNIWSTGTMVILHLVALFLVTDIIALLVRGIRRLCQTRIQSEPAVPKGEEPSSPFRQKRAGPGRVASFCRKLYGCGLIPVLAAALIFLYGYWNMGHIRETRYQMDSEKQVGQYRVVLLTDIHYGTIQDGEALREALEKISAQQPDIVILGGDIVDEGTSLESMREVFLLLGSIESRYGVYYIYGNHDRQPYTENRTFINEQLIQAIEAGGIRILRDEWTAIGDDLILAGREDAIIGRYLTRRAATEEILQGADREKFLILADHEPVDAAENAAQGVDLMLSGHTHGGQIWPVGFFNELTGMNYGAYQEDGCKVIVSSGAAGWGYPIRTGGHCEYVVIDIKGRERETK